MHTNDKPLRVYYPNDNTTEYTAIREALEQFRTYGLDKIDMLESFLAPGSMKQPERSIKQAIIHGGQESRSNDMHDAAKIMQRLADNRRIEMEKGKDDHYSLLVIPNDIYVPGKEYVLAVARKGFGAIVSTARMPDDPKLKHLVLRELGHVFGAPSDGRDSPEGYDKSYCSNPCIMQIGSDSPNRIRDLERIIQNSPENAFCGSCETDIKDYLRRY
jgi:predicted Zn-dependent protease